MHSHTQISPFLDGMNVFDFISDKQKSEAEKISFLKNFSLDASKNIELEKLNIRNDKEGNFTLLHTAATHCGLEVNKWLIENNPALLKMASQYGTNALFYAVKSANLTTVKYFLALSEGAALAKSNPHEGSTILFFALVSGNIEMINFIYSYVGNTRVSNLSTYNNTMLQITFCQLLETYIKDKNLKCIDFLFAHNLVDPIILDRIFIKDINLGISFLIQKKLINPTDHLELMNKGPRFRFEAHADRTIANQFTAINALLFAGDFPDLLEKACKNGVDILEMEDGYVPYFYKGKHPIHWAIELGRIKSLKFLISKPDIIDINVETADYDRLSPFLLALAFNQYEAASLLKNVGATLPEQNIDYRWVYNNNYHKTCKTVRPNEEGLYQWLYNNKFIELLIILCDPASKNLSDFIMYSLSEQMELDLDSIEFHALFNPTLFQLETVLILLNNPSNLVHYNGYGGFPTYHGRVVSTLSASQNSFLSEQKTDYFEILRIKSAVKEIANFSAVCKDFTFGVHLTNMILSFLMPSDLKTKPKSLFDSLSTYQDVNNVKNKSAESNYSDFNEGYQKSFGSLDSRIRFFEKLHSHKSVVSTDKNTESKPCFKNLF